MKKVYLLLTIVVCLAAVGYSQDENSVSPLHITRTTRDLPPITGSIYYGGGPVMSASTTVYVVYYGTWSSTSTNIINTWLQHLGNTPLFNINTTYHDSTGAGVQNVVNYNPAADSYADNYSLGKTLTDANIQTIVSNAIANHHLPADPNGVYFVLTASDVSQSSSNGSLCVNYCGYHSPSTSIVTGDTIKYSIVGNFAKCPSACDGNIYNGDSTTPNGDVGGDGAVNVMFHELSETVSDPNVTLSNGAWGDLVTEESGDFCNFYFGTWTSLPRAGNGSHYDVTISGVNYLIQQLFEVSAPTKPVKGTDYSGSCAATMGNGTATVSPTSINFGQHFYGDPPAYRTVTLTNNETEVLDITSLGAGLYDDPFLVSATTCGSTLGPGANCSITVEFDTSNAANGTSNATLTIVDSATNSPQNVPLTGKMSCPGGQCP